MEYVDLKAALTGVKPRGCVQPYLSGFTNELISAGHALGHAAVETEGAMSYADTFSSSRPPRVPFAARLRIGAAEI